MADTPAASGLRGETVQGYLDRLASRTPTPAGGVVAALSTAQAAALIAMGARFTTGRRYADLELDVEALAARADTTRQRALELAEADHDAVTVLLAAYSLPREDAEARSAAIRDATGDAAVPPAELVTVTRELVAMLEQLVSVANPSVTADLAAAAAAVQAAVSTSALNVEANVGSLRADDPRRGLLAEVADAEEIIRRASAVREAVRREVVT